MHLRNAATSTTNSPKTVSVIHEILGRTKSFFFLLHYSLLSCTSAARGSTISLKLYFYFFYSSLNFILILSVKLISVLQVATINLAQINPKSEFYVDRGGRMQEAEIEKQ